MTTRNCPMRLRKKKQKKTKDNCFFYNKQSINTLIYHNKNFLVSFVETYNFLFVQKVIMKKLIIFFSLIILSSCSQDYLNDNDPVYIPKTHIHPPTWIHGTWKDANDRLIYFTFNDLLYKYPMQQFTSSDSEINYYESKYFKEYNEYRTANVQEVELNDFYSINYDIYSGTRKKFSFIRLSDTEIEATGYMSGIYIKQ